MALGRCCRRGIAISRAGSAIEPAACVKADQLAQRLPWAGGGGAASAEAWRLRRLSGMIRGPVPARPLSPRCGLSGDELTT